MKEVGHQSLNLFTGNHDVTNALAENPADKISD